jgi:hypothetical protein
MIRVLLAVVAVAAFSLGACAEEAVVRLEVRPMPAPKPALKYQLLPDVAELKPGNPGQNYLKCFMEQRTFFYGKEAVAERAGYLSLPLAELPADKLRNYGGNALRQADWAARLDSLDWQVTQHLQSDGLDAALPEPTPLRVLASALQVRFRGHVAGRRFEDGVGSAKTMFALARHLGEYPAEAANQVGLSVAGQALDTLEEMVQQRGCPNLYWALTDLPCPLVELRKGLQGQRALVAADLRSLREEPMTGAEVEKFVGRLSGVMSFAREQAGEPPRSLRAALAARVKDPERVRAARGRLIEAGGKEDLVGKLPPAQVILLDEKRAYDLVQDERFKLVGLALWQVEALRGSGSNPGADGGEDGLFADLLPDVLKLRRTQGRLEQRIALLRHVEALRLYAAAHDGKPPEKLTDCPVPLPDDPFTGKPFGYHVEGQTAHLSAGPPRGDNVRYEVTIRK